MKKKQVAVLLFCCGIALVAVQRGSNAASVNLSLDVYPTNAANPNGGGTWKLIAKTNSAFGIAAVNTYIAGIDVTGVSYGPGINASLNGGQPYIFPGPPVNFLYFQDPGLPGVVVGVGAGAGTASNIPVDPCGDPAWNNHVLIGMGTYSGTVPSFASSGLNVTDANTFSTATPPFHSSLDADTTFIVRVKVPEPVTAAFSSFMFAALAIRRRA